MKKIVVSFILITIFFINSNSLVYAADDDGGWVSDAFSAASTFLKEPTKDSLGILNPTFKFFQGIVKGINRVLIVLLAGISTIALSVTGVRYMASGASPEQRDVAKHSLHTIFVGMAFGFGAYVIWRIAMGIVAVIIGAFG